MTASAGSTPLAAAEETISKSIAWIGGFICSGPEQEGRKAGMIEECRETLSLIRGSQSETASITVECFRSGDGRIFTNVNQNGRQLAHLKAGESYTVESAPEAGVPMPASDFRLMSEHEKYGAYASAMRLRGSPSAELGTSDDVLVPRRFLSEFMKALNFHNGHGEPTFSRVSAVMLHEEARELLKGSRSATASACPERDRLIVGYGSLAANWNSYGAEPFAIATINLALKVSGWLSSEWHCTPCADGPSVYFYRGDEEEIIEVRTHAEPADSGLPKP